MTGDTVRLLIVEDEVRLASALQRGLASEGFTVDVAHTGPDGLHAAQETTYDAVILDIMLPELSGYRIIEQLREDQNWVPILMLTAKDGEYDEADALDLGADDYLTKPFSFVVLLARIRALLRRGVAPRPAALTVDDLVLNPAAHTVARGQTIVELTPREFSLLEFLMRRAGDAVSKADILHHVWDANYEGDANVVEVYIGYLRRKIDVPFGRQSLQTIRGAGYRLTIEHPAPTPA
jgi:two-component system OmpR family response regulator